MEITYQGLRIVLPLDGIIMAEDVTLDASFNHHAEVSLLLLADEENIENSIHSLPDGASIEVYEKEVLFKGKVIETVMIPSKGLQYLKIRAVSYTSEWELAAVSQSFLNLDATYGQVLNKVLENYPNADIKDCITQGAVIPDFLLQYEETDWDFLIRLASSFQSFLVPDYKAGYGRAYFGIPQLGDEVVLSEEEYDIIKNLDQYNRVNVNGELLHQEAIRWNVKTGRLFELAQKVQFRGISTIVTKIQYRVVKGELCRFYELSREKGCLSVPLKNKNIFGMSIPATVKERSGNCVRVHFHIDPEYDNSPNTKYFTYAIACAFAQGAVTFTSQNYGVGKLKRMDKVLRDCAILSISIAVVLGGLAYCFGPQILTIYTSDPKVINCGMEILAYTSITYFLCGIMDLFPGALRGMGYSAVPMVLSVIGTVGTRIVWVFGIFPNHRSLSVLFVSYPVSWILTIVLQVVCFYFVRKRVHQKEKRLL